MHASIEVGVVLPEQARDIEDDIAVSVDRLGRSDGEREVAGHGVHPPTERTAAAALTGSRAKTSADRCRERRPSIRPDTDLVGRWSAGP